MLLLQGFGLARKIIRLPPAARKGKAALCYCIELVLVRVFFGLTVDHVNAQQFSDIICGGITCWAATWPSAIIAVQFSIPRDTGAPNEGVLEARFSFAGRGVAAATAARAA